MGYDTGVLEAQSYQQPHPLAPGHPVQKKKKHAKADTSRVELEVIHVKIQPLPQFGDTSLYIFFFSLSWFEMHFRPWIE